MPDLFSKDEALALCLIDPVATKLMGWFAQMMATPILRSVQTEACTGGLSDQSLHSPSIDDVALHLAKRTLSRSEDEILAIAGLFGLDAGSFVPLDADQRLARFLTEHNGGKVPRDILFLDGPKLPVEGFTWAPRSFMSRQMDRDLKGASEGAMSMITDQGLLGPYFCLVFQDDWANDTAPKKYRIRTDMGETLVIHFERDHFPEDGDNDSIYNLLVLLRPVSKGEEYLAVAAQLVNTMRVGDEEDHVLQAEIICYVHVFNEERNKKWNTLPISNIATGATSLVLLS